MRWLQAGAFWIADDGTTLHAFDRSSGDRLRLQGALRETVLSGRCEPRLSAMARVDARARALELALDVGAPQPLTRADVLRGTGFSLLFIELTARCNERCSHCYAEAAPERAESLTWPAIRSAIEDAAELEFRCVQLTGGDPLLHPHVVDAAMLVRERAIPDLEIYTNGLLLSPRMLARLSAAAPKFAFSVYSHEPTAHDAITGVPGSHARTLRALRDCLERGFAVRAGVILFEHTAPQRAAISDALAGLGLSEDAIGFSTSRAVGRGHAYAAHDEGGSHGLGVSRGAGKASVAYDGNVYPCIFARQMRLGNVYERSLRSVLEEPVPVSADVLGIGGRARRAAERLACADCRVRDAMLAPEDHDRPRLVQLGTMR